jgi:prepilin-type N-terminal cleavage/methylation domain-containing protein
MRTPSPPLARPRAAGFTLIEIMITLAVFGVGMLALAAVIPLAVRKNDASSQQSRASELAAACAERLLDTPYLEHTAGVHDDPANPYFGRYHLRWTVEDDQPLKSSKRITIGVHLNSTSSAAIAKLVVVTSESGS